MKTRTKFIFILLITNSLIYLSTEEKTDPLRDNFRLKKGFTTLNIPLKTYFKWKIGRAHV